MSNTKKKLSLICFSGDYDKVLAAFTLATGAAAVNYEVNMFFTFWGLNVLKKKYGRRLQGKGILDRAFNFLMGGRHYLPLSRFNFAGLGPKLMAYMKKKNNIATLPELIDAAHALDVNLYPCEMAMIILGIKTEDLIPEAKGILGVAKFLEISEGGQMLFI
jgi:peroxiredoxin family protein